MLVVAIRREEVDVSYSDRNELERSNRGDALQGSLDQLMSMVPRADWRLILVNFLLKCISQGWNTSVQTLRSQGWVLRYKDNVLWVALKKS